MGPLNVSNSTLSNRTDNVLPLAPVLTPAFGVAGALFIITGLAYCLVGRKEMALYGLLSCIYSFSLGVTVLIVETVDLPVSHGAQGAYLVAIVLPALALSAVISQLFYHNAAYFGGFIGGFCVAMWFETLRPGGLIQSQLVAIWIVLVSLIGCACAYWSTTKHWAHPVSSAFAGATAIVLGVDCFSGAGLKEFWVYTWRLRNDEIFSYQTTTYPLTKGIKAEIGCILGLFVFGLISQYKLYSPSIIGRKLAKRLLNKDYGRRTGDIESPDEVTDTRNRSSIEVPQEEKKTPIVEQIQVSPDSPPQTDHRRSHSVANRVQNWPNSDARTLVATSDELQRGDEFSPVDVPTDNADPTVNSLQTRTLRPISHPPRPIIPHSDDASDSCPDNIDFVNANATGNSLPFLSDRVSSSDGLPRSVTPKEIHLDLTFPWERTSGDSDGDRNSVQKSTQHCDQDSISKPHIDQQGASEQHQESQRVLQSPDLPDPASRSRKRGSFWSLKLAEMNREQEEVMNRTNEWRKAVVHIEPESSESPRLSFATEESQSLWSNFEGTHTTDSIVDQTASKDLETPRLPGSALSRASPLKQKKRRSRRVSIVEGKAAILPAPVRSARVHERNMSLPVLNTAANFMDHREEVLGQRRKHKSYTHALAVDGSAGHVAMRNFHSAGWVPPEEDDMTLAERRASLQAARTISSGQASTVSSHVPYTPNSTCVQSPATTTARTTPIASSPAHPPFITTAIPLHGSYPSPPGGKLTPIAPYRYAMPSSVPNGMNTPTFGGDIPRPTIQDNGIATPHTPRIPTVPVKGAPPTLVGQIEQQEKRRKQQRDDLQKAQQKAAEETEKLRKEVQTQRHNLIQAERMRRSGNLENLHRANLRKMQKQATDNANRAGLKTG